jgi:hypothetical protein
MDFLEEGFRLWLTAEYRRLSLHYQWISFAVWQEAD